jgi:hypothetical protein
MADRVASDHSSVTTVRATLARRGSTNRPAIELPDDHADAFPVGDVVRVVLGGDERHARIEEYMGDRVIPGVYDAPSFARDPGSADNRLVEWADDADLELGQSVLVDVVEEGFKYGVRQPGERVFYEATESPDDSLSSIAKQLDGDR